MAPDDLVFLEASCWLSVLRLLDIVIPSSNCSKNVGMLGGAKSVRAWSRSVSGTLVIFYSPILLSTSPHYAPSWQSDKPSTHRNVS
jgi:hypothetical protein